MRSEILFQQDFAHEMSPQGIDTSGRELGIVEIKTRYGYSTVQRSQKGKHTCDVAHYASTRSLGKYKYEIEEDESSRIVHKSISNGPRNQ